MSSTSYWTAQAEAVVAAVHRIVPADACLKARMKAVDEAYPFGTRKYHPYKVWLKVRRDYLKKFGYRRTSKALEESPMERMMRRSGVDQ